MDIKDIKDRMDKGDIMLLSTSSFPAAPFTASTGTSFPIDKEIKFLDKTNLALLLLDLDVKVPTEAWGLGNDEEQLKKDKVEIEQRLLALNGSFDFINARGNVRFHALKGYWQSRDGDSAGNVENWLNALASLKTAAPEFLFLNREIVLYHFLVENLYESLRDNGHFIHILRKTGAGLIKSLKVIGEKLKEVKYPFEHQKGAISMADYLVDAALPHEQDIERVFNLVNSANSNFLSLYYELLSKLAVKIAEVE
ncbi:MAG: hypothetical protein GY757_30260 [bacterium]|nr:hypothetical protein [bacterium]